MNSKEAPNASGWGAHTGGAETQPRVMHLGQADWLFIESTQHSQDLAETEEEGSQFIKVEAVVISSTGSHTNP